MCVVAYTQFLASYRSVKIESMAASFGVSTAFLDAELSRFISAGRIHAKIDKVCLAVEAPALQPLPRKGLSWREVHVS
jgi:26S proteasome regulatory subunit N7|eukprot:SAG25_NODE_501_length_7358_cov_11.235156_9_plen_78_part_00